MILSNSLKVLLVFLFLNIFLPFSQAGVKFFQTSKMNSNGTISITFTYGTNTASISKSNNIVGSLPFTAEGVKEYFAFPTGEIKKTIVYKDPNDANNTNVTVDIIAKDFSKITSAKALAGIKIAFSKSDSGNIFSWLVPETFMKSNSIDTYQFILTVDGQFKSSNTAIKNNQCEWYIFKDKIFPGGAYFLATYNLNQNTGVSTDTSKNTSDKGKSCGLFGLELPILLVAGAFLSRMNRKKSNVSR